jgi:broad specificity phosphatase PhoE
VGRLYLVRHGRTAWNRGDIFRGTVDVPLDDVGREQARLVRDALFGLAPGTRFVYCSPLSRAKETAEIVASAFLGVRAEPDDRFTDIDVGEWSGMPLTEVEARYPELYDTWVRAPREVRFPGGQTLQEVQDQAWNGVQTLVPLLHDSDVILVSHRLTLKTIILKAVGSGLENFWTVRLDTASTSVLETGHLEIGHYGGEDILILSRLNDVSHLRPLKLPDRIDF